RGLRGAPRRAVARGPLRPPRRARRHEEAGRRRHAAFPRGRGGHRLLLRSPRRARARGPFARALPCEPRLRRPRLRRARPPRARARARRAHGPRRARVAPARGLPREAPPRDRGAQMKKLGLVAALLLLAPRVAAAWTYIELTHPRWGTPFEIELGAPSADLEGIAAGTTEAELQKAIDDWRFVPCAEVPIDLVGQSGAAAILGDGKNVVTFYESDWPHDFSFVGMTSYETDSCSAGWCMVEADVELNGVNYVWTDVRGSLPY